MLVKECSYVVYVPRHTRLLIRATIQLLTWFVTPIHDLRGVNGKPGRRRRTTLRITTVTTVRSVVARTLRAGPAVGRRVAVVPFITDFERVFDRPEVCRDTRPTKRRRQRGDGTVSTRPSPASGYFLRLEASGGLDEDSARVSH